MPLDAKRQAAQLALSQLNHNVMSPTLALAAVNRLGELVFAMDSELGAALGALVKQAELIRGMAKRIVALEGDDAKVRAAERAIEGAVI